MAESGINPEAGLSSLEPILDASATRHNPTREKHATPIVFLLSAAASDVNGATIPVDAG